MKIFYSPLVLLLNGIFSKGWCLYGCCFEWKKAQRLQHLFCRTLFDEGLVYIKKINPMAALEITKQFDTSKDALYKAWTDPEQLKQWWKPLDNQLMDVEEDLKEGGGRELSF